MKKTEPLSEIGEFGWLRRLLPRLYWPSGLRPQLCIGAGDDAGVLRITPGKVLVGTTDAMVEGVHFERKWFPWEALGEKLLAVNLSDLAAMGKVRPLAALVTAAVPGDTAVNSVDKFYRGLESCAQRWKTGLLGGDTVGSHGGWFVSITVLGEADPRNLVRRSGAQAGDYLVASGPLGMAAAGLEVCRTRKSGWSWTQPLIESFCRPQPRLREGAILGQNHLATSLMDCSDGLEASVRLIAQASEVGIEVDAASLPIHPALARWAKHTGRAAWRYALSGGEEYELLFTVHPKRWPRVKGRLSRAAVIGRVTPAREGCRAVYGSQTIPLSRYGYAHFEEK